MRILLVNANTSQSVTDACATEARAAASPGTEIVPVTGRFGARVIASRSENAIATHAAIELVARHARGCDAVVVAVSLDTAVDAARELVPIPVVGMTEAAMLTACMLGGKFGMVTVGRRTNPVYRELVDRSGLGGRLAALRAIDTAPASAARDPAGVAAAVVAAAGRMVDEDEAESVILVGAAVAGLARRLQAEVPVPLLDGISCGVRQAELLARLGVPRRRAGSYAPVTPSELTGVDPAVVAAYREE